MYNPVNIIFDLDGTLIDSATTIACILNDMRMQIGKDCYEVSYYRKIISEGANNLIISALGIPPIKANEYLAEFRFKYAKALTPMSSLYPNVLETINTLMELGNGIGICSNKPVSLCNKILKDLGLTQYFSIVIGGDSLPHSKPHIAPIEFVIEKLGSNKFSPIMVGDSSIDQKTALIAGIPFVFFAGGYDDGVEISKCDDVINDISQLLDMDLSGIASNYKKTKWQLY